MGIVFWKILNLESFKLEYKQEYQSKKVIWVFMMKIGDCDYDFVFLD